MLRVAALNALIAVIALGAAGCAPSPPNDALLPARDWPRATPAADGIDSTHLVEARTFALRSGGAGSVVHRGRVVMQWGDPAERFDLKSATKAIGVTALGLALADGRMRLDDRVVQHHPTFGTPPDSNARTGWPARVTLLQLATQTAGFAKRGGYEPMLFEPGTGWAYSDGGPNWLAEALTLAYHRDLEALLFERVFTPIGIGHDQLVWRANLYRPHRIDGTMRREFGAGISASVDAMARIGLLYLRDGRWGDRQLLPRAFVARVRRPQAEVEALPVRDGETSHPPRHYGLLWWNNADGALPNVPRDAYWAWGLYESLILVVPSLDLVVARAGPRGWDRPDASGYEALAPFFDPIVAAVRSAPH